MKFRSRSARPMIASVCVCLAMNVQLATPALAAGPDAAALKTRADAAFDGRNYSDALAQYEAALARGADPRIHYNIAQTLTALERYPEALASYQAFLAEAPSGTLNSAQQTKFFALLDDLKSRISRVEILCAVPGARVLIRDKAVGTTPIDGAIAVNAGLSKIEVLAEGFKPFVGNVVLGGDRVERVNVVLERIDFTGVVSVTSNVPGSRVSLDGADRGVAPQSLRAQQGAHLVRVRANGYVEQSRTVMIEPGGHGEASFVLERSPDYKVAYASFGVGLVGIAAGTVTGVLAFTTLASAKLQCDTADKQCGPTGQPDLQSSKTYGIVSTVAFGVGAAGIGVGIYGLLNARHGHPSARPVEVVLRPGGLYLIERF